MKKMIIYILTLVMVLSMAACDNNGKEEQSADITTDPMQSTSSMTEPDTSQQMSSDIISAVDSVISPEEPTDAELSPWLQTKTGKFYSQFEDGMYMEYETEYEGSVMTVVTATNGDKTYSESKMEGQSMGVSIMDVESVYAIDHAGKTVVKMSLQTSGQEMMDTMIEEGDIDPASVVTGQREIEGRTYDTEEWSMDGAKSILCFDGDNLAYIIGEVEGMETVIKVIKTSRNVDNSLFEIPTDYQMISY